MEDKNRKIKKTMEDSKSHYKDVRFSEHSESKTITFIRIRPNDNKIFQLTHAIDLNLKTGQL